jgi:lipoyl(octanoyl) transferase
MEYKIDISPQDFKASIEIMENRVKDITKKDKDELVWLLNYPSMYTCGAKNNDKDLINKNIFPVFQTNRGGKYTYHGPGQRIVYLMIDQNKRQRDIRNFVELVEKTIIMTLQRFGLNGIVRNTHHGVFIRKNDNKLYKIASIGLKFKRWVSYHGFSFNINPDLEHYIGINPCGLKSNTVTSLKDLGIEIDREEFDDIVIQEINNTFN